MSETFLQRWWSNLDRPGWRSFAIAMLALAVALGLSLYSAAAAETGNIVLAGACALAALGLAGWVALTIVPVLARRTPLRWLAYHIDYKFTREGVIYVAGVFVIALAALNTGNNLLFMILASMLAGIIVSGILSSICLSGVEMKLELPEHLFARQPVMAAVELRNEKYSVPSFSLRVSGEIESATPGRKGRKEKKPAPEKQILTRPVYFPFLPAKSRGLGTVRQQVELEFPRRGAYRQDTFGIVTKFPFGFLQKTRRVESPMEIIVYPRVEPTEEFYEVLPLLSGEMESFYRGRGHDLYSIRDYQSTDSARFVDWKASAKTSALKVREFTREDERRVLLVLDPFVAEGGEKSAEQFERAVTLAACLAWHFHEIDSELQFCTAGYGSPMASAGEVIYPILRELALIAPQRAAGGGNFLAQLADESDTFKIILTSQPRGSIPTALWTSSYFIFIQSL
jgi:uncharacterized protein (DUF58 family)